jgi:hypothetical protein
MLYDLERNHIVFTAWCCCQVPSANSSIAVLNRGSVSTSAAYTPPTTQTQVDPTLAGLLNVTNTGIYVWRMRLRCLFESGHVSLSECMSFEPNIEAEGQTA